MGDLSADRAGAAFDSASAMVRATGRALRGEPFPHLGRKPLETVPVRLSALLPSRLRRAAFALLGGTEGVPPDRLGDVDMDAAASWVVSHYDADDYPGVVIGSSNGAAVHLCAATGMPFLPQTLLVPVRWPGSDPDRPDLALEFGRRVAPPLLDRNRDVVLHHMHDGAQDRLMVSRMAYFRLKWNRLPPAYAQFLRARLRPGAPVVLLADGSSWPVTHVDERHVFQSGAQGGLRPEEYLTGSPRVAGFLRDSGSAHDRFRSPAADGEAPEAEWGFEAGLETSVREAARAGGRPVHVLRYGSPQDLSGPVADLLRARIRAHGGEGDRLLVESFVMLDPAEAVRTGSVPFWTFFGVEARYRAVDAYTETARRAGDAYRDVYVMSFPNGVAGPGATPPAVWPGLLRHVTGRVALFPGSRRWPAHFDSLVRYGPALRRLPTVTRPPTVPLPVPEMLAACAAAGLTVEGTGAGSAGGRAPG